MFFRVNVFKTVLQSEPSFTEVHGYKEIFKDKVQKKKANIFTVKGKDTPTPVLTSQEAALS